jgi:hypothetical protein
LLHSSQLSRSLSLSWSHEPSPRRIVFSLP